MLSLVAVAGLALARAGDSVVTAGVRVTALAVVALLAALVHGWPRLVPLPLLMVAGLYGAHLAVDDRPLDPLAPLVAAGLYVTAELAYWSLEERVRVVSEPGESLRRIAAVSGLALLALLAGAVLLALVDTVRARGLTVDVLGAAAAAGALLVVVLLARERSRAGT